MTDGYYYSNTSINNTFFFRVLNGNIWGLSFFRESDEGGKNAYRTLGLSLKEFQKRWPNVLLKPDYDRTQTIEG